ncbi:hypothetical protein G9A89_011399 [Geosiphon pyriformis]|nr:hypothetical protein G9A89_011399 [Geosiphon pyriformis]
MTYIGKFNKLLRRICQLETNDYYSDAQILDQFITGLKDKLIKKICPHAPKDLNFAIQHAKRYEMAMEKANCTKLMNLAIRKTSSTVEKKINQLTKKVENYFTNQQQQQPQRYQPPQRQNQNNFTSLSNNQPQNCHYSRIAENANLLDIFPFKFEANESPFLLSNAAANEQKAITAIYIEAEVEKKPIRLILDSGFAGSIITYQLMQQLKRNVDRPAQTVIITANGMKKTPVGEIDNFPFTLDEITIPVKLQISYQEQHAQVPATCNTFNKCSKKALAFEFELKKEKPIIETFMALESTSNWADKTEQHVLNKLYHYPHDAKMIFDLAMALINRATKEDVHQMKEAEYIDYIIELAGFDYEDKLCEECIMFCDEKWCSECYALSIPLPSENDENEIEFGEPEATEEIGATPIYLIKNQSALQFKYFNNNRQEIKPKKAHEIDAGYDLRYPDKDTLVLKPKSLTKINLKIALEILPGAMVQIASRSFLASKEINVKEGIINAGYTGDIKVILQNKTDKLFNIEHAEKIAQAIYLPLINISDLQLVSQREQLGKSERRTNSFGSTGRFTVSVNIALNEQSEFHQILRLPQPITISPFGKHLEIYTCLKPTTTQQIFESNKQICLEHNILIPNIYIPGETKKI